MGLHLFSTTSVRYLYLFRVSVLTKWLNLRVIEIRMEAYTTQAEGKTVEDKYSSENACSKNLFDKKSEQFAVIRLAQHEREPDKNGILQIYYSHFEPVIFRLKISMTKKSPYFLNKSSSNLRLQLFPMQIFQLNEKRIIFLIYCSVLNTNKSYELRALKT